MERPLLIVNIVFTAIFAVLVIILLFDVSKIDTRTGDLPGAEELGALVEAAPGLHDQATTVGQRLALLQKQVSDLTTQMQTASQELARLTAEGAAVREQNDRLASRLDTNDQERIAGFETLRGQLASRLQATETSLSDINTRLSDLMKTLGLTGVDISGDWLLTLPSGATQAVSLTDMGNDRFNFKPDSLLMSGVYRLDGDRLAMLRPNDRRFTEFTWAVEDDGSLVLVEEPDISQTGQSFAGATLTRP